MPKHHINPVCTKTSQILHHTPSKETLLDQNAPFVSFLGDGGWGEWGHYTECSETCGMGSMERIRICDNPPATNGGNPCVGHGSEIEDCNEGPCPGRGYSIMHSEALPYHRFNDFSSACKPAYHVHEPASQRPVTRFKETF